MSVEAASLLADAACTHAKVIDSSGNEDKSSDIAYELLEKAQAIDARLASWPEGLPLHWYPIRVFKDNIPQEVMNAGMYGDSCEIYPDIMICSTWNDWRVARLKVLRLIAKLHLVAALDHIDTGTRVTSEIQQLVDGICASIPFNLGSRSEPAPLYESKVVYPGLKGRLHSDEHHKTASAYGGWYLFSPLKETMELGPYISQGQQDWLRHQLYRLARVYDVKPA